MFDLRGDCRPGDSGESAIDENGAGDKPPKGEEVKKMIQVCYYEDCGVVYGEKEPLSDKRTTHGLCPNHLKISLREIKAEMEKISMVNG